MKVKDFINEYNTTYDKKYVIETHITKKYLPFVQKNAMCADIAQRTCHTNDDGSFNINSPIRNFFFILAILENYTDIEIDYSEASGIYDALDERGLLDEIIKSIPQKEFEVLKAMLGMCVDDLMTNERSIGAVIDRKMDALMMTLNVIQDAVKEVTAQQ